MELNIRLAEVFLAFPGGVLSIHQIAQNLEIPYGTAYNRIHDLGKTGIVTIVPQGRAKLCSLNPENPMTGALLGLGAARRTIDFVRSHRQAGALVGKLRNILEGQFKDHLHTAILLNPDSLAPLNSPENQIINSDETPGGSAPGLDSEDTVSLDFFLIMTTEETELRELERAVLPGLYQQHHLRVTRMVVTPSTLTGMLQEKENEAGMSAYHMLRKGIVLLGFDKFFNLVLRAFSGNPFRS